MVQAVDDRGPDGSPTTPAPAAPQVPAAPVAPLGTAPTTTVSSGGGLHLDGALLDSSLAQSYYDVPPEGTVERLASAALPQPPSFPG